MPIVLVAHKGGDDTIPCMDIKGNNHFVEIVIPILNKYQRSLKL